MRFQLLFILIHQIFHGVHVSASPSQLPKVVAFPNDQSVRQTAFTRNQKGECISGFDTMSNIFIRGGEVDFDDEYDYDAYDEYDEDELPPPPRPRPRPPARDNRPLPPRSRIDANQQQRRRRRQPPPSPATRRSMNTKKNPALVAVDMAKKTADVATSTAVSSIKGSTRAALHLASPKHVSRGDITGVWRFDQQVGDLPDGPFTSCAANIEFTPKGEIITAYNEKEMISTFLFTERRWPRSCTIEFEARAFQGPNDKEPVKMLYKGYFKRKLANRNIIKIEGKIYSVSGGGRLWSRKREVLVGSFIARKRIDSKQVQNGMEDDIDDGYDDYEEDFGYDDYDDLEDYDEDEYS